MITIRVTWSDGDHTVTGINATLEEARGYYVGQVFVHYPEGPDGLEALRSGVKVELEPEISPPSSPP